MIKNSTKADAEVIARATLYQTKKVRIIILISGIVVLFIGIAVLCVNFVEQRNNTSFNPDWEIIICFAVAIFFITFSSGMSRKSTQIKNAEKLYRGEAKQYEFTFSEEGFELSYSESFMTGTAKGQYAVFLKVCEYADMYLLFLNSRVMYIVLKSGITEGTPEELSALFREKVYDRYKVCYKK